MIKQTTIFSSYFNTQSGETIKVFSIDKFFYYFNRGNIVQLDQNLKEQLKIPVSWNRLSSMCFYGSRFLIGDSQGTFYILQQDYSKTYQNSVLDGSIEVILQFKDLIIIAGGNQIKVAQYINTKELNQLKNFQKINGITKKVLCGIIDQDKLYLGGESNQVFVFDTQLNLVHKTPMANSFITSLISINDINYYTSMIGEINSIDQKNDFSLIKIENKIQSGIFSSYSLNDRIFLLTSNFCIIVIKDHQIESIVNLQNNKELAQIIGVKNKSLKIVNQNDQFYLFTLNKEMIILDQQLRLIQVKYYLDQQALIVYQFDQIYYCLYQDGKIIESKDYNLKFDFKQKVQQAKFLDNYLFININNSLIRFDIRNNSQITIYQFNQQIINFQPYFNQVFVQIQNDILSVKQRNQQPQKILQNFAKQLIKIQDNILIVLTKNNEIISIQIGNYQNFQQILKLQNEIKIQVSEQILILYEKNIVNIKNLFIKQKDEETNIQITQEHQITVDHSLISDLQISNNNLYIYGSDNHLTIYQLSQKTFQTIHRNLKSKSRLY